MQVYEFNGKSEKLKKKKLWISTNKKVQKSLCRKIYREVIITYTAQAHSKPSQTSKMNSFANMNNYFHKNSLNRYEISSQMLSNNSVKIKLRLYAKIFHHVKPSWNFPTIWTNRVEIFILRKRVEKNHVINH